MGVAEEKNEHESSEDDETECEEEDEEKKNDKMGHPDLPKNKSGKRSVHVFPE